jgi:hypothetical protein
VRAKIIVAGVFAAALALPGAASANPNGAPWGSADPAGAQSCSSCHFDGEAISDSASISLFFKESQITPGEAVDLYVQLRNPDNTKAGFQIIASAGAFTSAYEDVEANGVQARSIAPRDNSSWPEILGITGSTNAVMWKLQWTPPGTAGGEVDFWVAVNAGNDDASPLGDQIHFRSFVVGAED